MGNDVGGEQQDTSRKGRLTGKVALITGASRGLGRAIAMRFAGEGALLAVTALRNRDLLEELVLELRANGAQAIAVAGDVGDPADARHLVEETLSAFGRLDVLVNNAGIDITTFRPLHEFDGDVWDDLLRTNLTGAFMMTKYAVPALLRSGRASVINIASVCGVQAWKGDAPYNVSKAGMIMLTQTAALDYAEQGIRFNAVCPGVIRTDMTQGVIQGAADPAAMESFFRSLHPMRVLGEPLDVANATLFLASDEAKFVTGAVLTVDGGMTAHGA